MKQLTPYLGYIFEFDISDCRRTLQTHLPGYVEAGIDVFTGVGKAAVLVEQWLEDNVRFGPAEMTHDGLDLHVWLGDDRDAMMFKLAFA